MQTLGVSHGLPRRSPSGRRRAHSSCQTGQTGQTSQTQAPHHRDPHTTVAIRQAHPSGISSPAPNQPETCKPTGYTVAHPLCPFGLFGPSGPFASATPPQHAYPVAIKKASHTPTAHLCLCHSKQRHRKPSGYHMAHSSCQTSQTGQTGQTQAPRRRPHTPVAIPGLRHINHPNLPSTIPLFSL